MHTQINNNKGGKRRPRKVIDLSMALMVQMVSWVYTYPQTHQIVYVKYIQIFLINHTSIKLFKKHLAKNIDKGQKFYKENLKGNLYGCSLEKPEQ